MSSIKIWLAKLGLGFCLLIALAPPALSGNITTINEDGTGFDAIAGPLTATPISGGGSQFVDSAAQFAHEFALIYAPDGVTPSDLFQFLACPTTNISCVGTVVNFYSLGLDGLQADVAALPSFDLALAVTATEEASGHFFFANPFGWQGNSSDVPEPTTLALLVAGLVGLGMFGRRHRCL